jgi:oxygen-dependent protoporphyrinogen oxidase
VAPQHVAGITLDAGAESFATRGGAVARLIDDLGMSDDVVWPNAAGAWLHLSDRTVPAPKGGLLGIPSDPLAADVVAAIGRRAALRAQLDRIIPTRRGYRPTTLGDLVRRRMGRAVLDRLVSPVSTGVYSSSADDLDVDAISPGLRDALARTRSLARAAQEVRAASAMRSPDRSGEAAAGAPTGSSDGRAASPASRPGSAAGVLRGGMWTLIRRLAADARARGVDIRLDAPVAAIVPGTTPAWRVRLEDGTVLTADAVVLAASGPESVRLLSAALASGERQRIAAPAQWPSPTRVDLATLVLDAHELDEGPRGTGLLVADDAHDRVAAKALTHATIKWEWLAEQTGPGRHVVRLSYGKTGRANPAAGLDDDALRARALSDASALLGAVLHADQVVGFTHVTWESSVSPAAHGQADRIRAVREAVRTAAGLEVAGAWVAGTGLA